MFDLKKKWSLIKGCLGFVGTVLNKQNISNWRKIITGDPSLRSQTILILCLESFEWHVRYIMQKTWAYNCLSIAFPGRNKNVLKSYFFFSEGRNWDLMFRKLNIPSVKKRMLVKSVQNKFFVISGIIMGG